MEKKYLKKLNKYAEKIPASVKGKDKLLEWIANGWEEQLFHIDIFEASEYADIKASESIEFFMQGLKAGIFSMNWLYHCPHCGGISREATKLAEAEHTGHCDRCKVDFSNFIDMNVEIKFSISEEICTLPSRLQENYNKTMMHDLKDTNKFNWENDSTIKASMVINSPIFRELLGDDILPEDQSLEIKKAVILFTDIKGSTQLYQEHGDAKAYKLVREHFKILFKQIEDNSGVIIKTIGDSVMAVFPAEELAVQTASESILNLREFSRNIKPGQVLIKAGIHSGQAIAVTLNNTLDYFGATVNTASRIESTAEASELMVSDSVFSSQEARKMLKHYVKSGTKFKTKLKGIEQPIELYRFKF